MEVCYVLGRAGAGKTRYLFREIENALARGKKAFYIVPEQYVLQAERELLQALGQKSLVGASVLSVDRLAERVAAVAGPLLRGRLNPNGLAMLTGSVIPTLDLRYFGQVAQKTGFYRKMAEQISELERQMIAPGELFDAADNASGTFADKLYDVAQIYQAVRGRIGGTYMDAHEKVRQMCERLADSGYLEGAFVALDSPEDYSRESTLFFSTLLDCCDSLMVALRLDYSKNAPDKGIFSLQREAFDGFREAAAQKGVAERIVELKIDAANRPPELAHLERNLFALPYERYEGEAAAVRLTEAPTAAEEVEWICCRIFNEARRHSYSQMAVLADLQQYGALFERAFERYGIPYFTDRRRSLSHHPVAILTSACLSCCEEGFLSKDMLALMKTGFCGAAFEEVERFENFVLRRGINGTRYKRPIKGEEHAEMEAVRARVMQPLLELEAALEAAQSAAEMVGALYDYFERIDLKEQLDKKVLSLYGSGKLDLAEEYAQVWNRGVVELLEQAQQILGEGPCSVSLLRRTLETGFDSLTLGIIPTAIDEVMLGEAGQSYLHDIDLLFVAGCNDGLIPKTPEQRLLGDEERRKLRKDANILLHDARFEQDVESGRLYAQFCKPKEGLYLSYALSAADGAALRPSILVHTLRGVFPRMRLEGKPADEELVCGVGGTFSTMVRELRREKSGEAIHPVWRDVFAYYRENGYGRRCALVERALAGENSAKQLTRKTARRLFGQGAVSASRLEEYNRCPFRHFVRYGLRPAPRENYTVEAVDRGNIYHEAIDAYIRRYGGDNLQISYEEARARMQEIFQPILREYGDGIFESSAKYRHMAKEIVRIGARSAWAIGNQMARSGFKPLYSEVRFGKGGNFPPIILELKDGKKLELSGRIDRVDGAKIGGNDYLAVVDYKSGNAKFDYGQVYAGVRLQLLIYMQALLGGALSKGTGAKAAGFFYFKVEDPTVDASDGAMEEIERQLQKELRLKGVVLEDVDVAAVLDEGLAQGGDSLNLPVSLTTKGTFRKDGPQLSERQIRDLLAFAKELSQQTAERMIGGKTDIFPLRLGGHTPCANCDYNDICWFDMRLSNSRREEKNLNKEEFFGRLEDLRHD